MQVLQNIKSKYSFNPYNRNIKTGWNKFVLKLNLTEEDSASLRNVITENFMNLYLFLQRKLMEVNTGFDALFTVKFDIKLSLRSSPFNLIKENLYAFIHNDVIFDFQRDSSWWQRQSNVESGILLNVYLAESHI